MYDDLLLQMHAIAKRAVQKHAHTVYTCTRTSARTHTTVRTKLHGMHLHTHEKISCNCKGTQGRSRFPWEIPYLSMLLRQHVTAQQTPILCPSSRLVDQIGAEDGLAGSAWNDHAWNHHDTSYSIYILS